ncbi:MAG TPA: pilus assembly protein TadG-related protein [Caulobacteraceae bacterium]|nr:pilus assembly protein TadG-related protein [Caulobacteraceae bacterium]
MFAKVNSRARTFVADRRGNVAVLASLALPLIVAGAAFGVETSYWYYKDLQLQAAADAAAYAGAIELRGGSDDEDVIAEATAQAVQNGFDPARGSILVTPADDEVEVTIVSNEPRFFSAVFASNDVSVRSRAVARFENATEACILALSGTASRAVNFSGNASLTLDGCSVMANSTAVDAIEQKGSSDVETPCAIAVGGVKQAGGLTLTDCDAPITGSSPADDPFEDLPEPANTGTCKTVSGNALTPGRYCNGMDLKQTKTLAAGTYIVSGGTLKINANANISGSGVTFFLTNGANVHYNGGATINLSAPTSGTYSGVLMFAAEGNTGGALFNGGASTQMTGALYFPDGALDYKGNVAGTNGCVQIVASTIEWTGSSTFKADCTAYGMSDIMTPGAVALKE